jgi:hypothetical protein
VVTQLGDVLAAVYLQQQQQQQEEEVVVVLVCCWRLWPTQHKDGW